MASKAQSSFGGKPASNSMCKDYVPVAEFYAGKSVFITGGTGFVGKVLVEKLIRSCPKIKNIYLLLRPKKGLTIASRIEELRKSQLFDKIMMECSEDFNKIVPIAGDIGETELGLSAVDQTMLCQEVSIVFHAAATIRFNENLKNAVTINMLGTQQLMQLCKRMSKLQALVHVSTAYSNCDKNTAEEIVYAPPFPPQHIISLVHLLPEDLLDKITPDLIGERPNTYTFTKALAEDMVLREAVNLPIAIIRPSIVLSSSREPVEGWLDSWNGPTGILAASGKGIFRFMRGDESLVADLVPVDIVTNLMIAAASKIYFDRSGRVLVFNCCTGHQNPIKWHYYLQVCFGNVRKHPFNDPLWYPTIAMGKNRYLYAPLNYLKNRLPAHIIDIILLAMGKKTNVLTIVSKVEKAAEAVDYFTSHQWSFPDTNVQALCSDLSPEDKETFDFDVKNIIWEDYLEAYVLGIKRFLLKESTESLPALQSKVKRLYIMHRILQYALPLLGCLIIFSRFEVFQNINKYIISLFN